MNSIISKHVRGTKWWSCAQCNLCVLWTLWSDRGMWKKYARFIDGHIEDHAADNYQTRKDSPDEVSG